MTARMILIPALVLSGCATTGPLIPKNAAAPSAPAATAKPTPEALMTPNVQARPHRTDEPLQQSEKRHDDRFDLPPPG